jgi:nucleoside-diphosphate-sugar epimerase
MMEAARSEGVKDYLCVSSACVYPRYCRIPTPEEEGFKDEPEPTNLGYGWAKRMAEIQARVYAQEFNMRIAVIRPYNTYGPRDHFELEKAHVIPALINKVASGTDPLVVWGDGEQSRSFVYVTDIAYGMMLILEKGVYAEAFNIGTEEEIKIKDLVALIIKLFDSRIKIRFEQEHLGGQPRRNADITKAKKMLGYTPKVTLEDGLKETILWYKQKYMGGIGKT